MKFHTDKNVTSTDTGAVTVSEGVLIPLSHVQITDLSSVTPLSPYVPEGARVAIIQAEVADVRWLDTVGNPSSSFGMVLYATADILYAGNLTDLKFIQRSAGAILNITFYK